MRKTARVIFFIIGIIFPIFIGALHLFAHFKELITPQVQGLLSGSISIFDKPELLYNTWGLMSMMMGSSFIVIGLLNGSIFSRMTKAEFPPMSALLTMVAYLGAVLYASSTFNALPQYYGSIFGLALIFLCIFLVLKKKAV